MERYSEKVTELEASKKVGRISQDGGKQITPTLEIAIIRVLARGGLGPEAGTDGPLTGRFANRETQKDGDKERDMQGGLSEI